MSDLELRLASEWGLWLILVLDAMPVLVWVTLIAATAAMYRGHDKIIASVLKALGPCPHCGKSRSK